MMSEAKKRGPKRRFKEFLNAGDWEQRKLLDIAKTFIGLVTTMTENYRDSGTLLIRNSDIKEGQFVFSENPIHLDEEFAKKNKTRRLQIGDVVTVHTGDIGTSAVIEEKEAGAIGFATINTRTDKSILNPYFLATYFNTEKHKCYANSVSTGDGRSNYNIKDFNKLVISVPTLDEQERISVLINDMNTIITLHQRKLDKLQATKKALLQEMFPEEGQDKPKRRFKGFADTWEQRKLLTVLNKIVDYRGRTPKKLGLDWSPSGHLALSALNVKMGYIDKTVDAHYGDDHLYSVWMKDNDLYEGQVLFTTEAPMGNVAQVPDDNKYILSQRTIAFVPDRSVISDNFLAVVLSASKCQKSLINRASGGTAKGVSQKTLSEISLDIPQSLSEQDKVSELIKKLSKIITLHQRKLDKLKNLKQAYLNEMFV